jgi:hypothetical protein
MSNLKKFDFHKAEITQCRRMARLAIDRVRDAAGKAIADTFKEIYGEPLEGGPKDVEKFDPIACEKRHPGWQAKSGEP